jgi:hypothetical protein
VVVRSVIYLGQVEAFELTASAASGDQDSLALQGANLLAILNNFQCGWTLIAWAIGRFMAIQIWTVWVGWSRHFETIGNGRRCLWSEVSAQCNGSRKKLLIEGPVFI